MCKMSVFLCYVSSIVLRRNLKQQESSLRKKKQPYILKFIDCSLFALNVLCTSTVQKYFSKIWKEIYTHLLVTDDPRPTITIREQQTAPNAECFNCWSHFLDCKVHVIQLTYPRQQSGFQLVEIEEIPRPEAKLYDYIQQNEALFYRRHHERDVFLVLPEFQTGSFTNLKPWLIKIQLFVQPAGKGRINWKHEMSNEKVRPTKRKRKTKKVTYLGSTCWCRTGKDCDSNLWSEENIVNKIFCGPSRTNAV